jgi:hypothetical protein
MGFQHVGHGGIRNTVTNVGQCLLDSIIALRRILSRVPQNGVHNGLPDSPSSENLSLIAEVPLSSHELTVPAQDRVGSHNGGQLQQRLPAEGMAFHCQYSTLITSQQQTRLAEFLQPGLRLSYIRSPMRIARPSHGPCSISSFVVRSCSVIPARVRRSVVAARACPPSVVSPGGPIGAGLTGEKSPDRAVIVMSLFMSILRIDRNIFLAVILRGN